MIFLCDMSSLIHAYFHIRTNDDKYDVTERTLHRLEKLRSYYLTQFSNARFFAVFDNPDRHTFRHVLFSEYKQDRTKHEDLPEIEASVRSAVANDSDWIGLVAPAMFEADDVIASVAKQSNEKVVIHSQDRDLHQCLVRDRVTILKKSTTPKAGDAMDLQYLTEDDFRCEYNFHPALWPKYQSIVGGKDNIDGWKYVGDKLARQICQKGLAVDLMTISGFIKLQTRQVQSFEEFRSNYPSILVARTLRTTLLLDDIAFA